MLRKVVFLSVLSIALLAVMAIAAVAMIDTPVQAETVEQVEVAPVQVVEPAAPVYEKASDGYQGCNYSKARLAEAPVQSVVPDDNSLAQAAE
ncbi:MAG: hypothetical protein F6K39_40085 [Okeania sp. SIO3B3]|nr:hypothetical protein [Okeania sp. SIO3B3]